MAGAFYRLCAPGSEPPTLCVGPPGSSAPSAWSDDQDSPRGAVMGVFLSRFREGVDWWLSLLRGRVAFATARVVALGNDLQVDLARLCFGMDVER